MSETTAPTTTVKVPGRADITGIPGTKTAQQIISMYSDMIPELGSMEHTTTQNGSVTVITFSRKSGTKG